VKPVEALARVSGLSQDEVHRIFGEVKENQKRLRECPGPHKFVPHKKLGTLVRDYVCTSCSGVLESQAVHWYSEGFEHGMASK
jgi:hypothetical protein